MNLGVYANACRRAYEHCDHVAGIAEFTETTHDFNGKLFAFRGTAKNRSGMGWFDLILDVIADIQFRPWIYPELDGFRPRGFGRAAMDVVEYLTGEDPKIDKKTRIFLTGHSLGAAIALLVGYALKRRGYWVVTIVALSPPRAGVLKWPSQSATQIKGVRYGRDPVPLLPPFWRKSVEYETIGDESGRVSLKDHRIDKICDWYEGET